MNELDNTIMEYKRLQNTLESGSLTANQSLKEINGIYESQKVMNKINSQIECNDVHDGIHSIKLIYYDVEGNKAGEHFLHVALLDRMTEQMQLLTFRTVIERLIGRKLDAKHPPR